MVIGPGCQQMPKTQFHLGCFWSWLLKKKPEADPTFLSSGDRLVMSSLKSSHWAFGHPNTPELTGEPMHIDPRKQPQFPISVHWESCDDNKVMGEKDR
jgi:hypothetical protein